MTKKVLTPEQTEVKMIKKNATAFNWTSIIAVLLSFVIAFGVVVFGKSTAENKVGSMETGAQNENNVVDSSNNSSSSGDYIIDEETGEIISGPTDSTDDTSNGETAEETEPTRELPANPAEWTKAEVVNFYKAAAQKSSPSTKSIQKMTMNNGMTVKLNNAALEFLIGLAEPVIQAALKANSMEIEGITGGFDNLVPSDAQSAKAYRDGKYIVVEMLMVEQVDDAYGDTFSGTVGHAISVVGNIAVVADQFPQFNINFKDAYGALTYKNPRVKVRINEKGIIEKGTWSYVVDVDVKNLQIEKVVVEHGATQIDYLITVGGGF